MRGLLYEIADILQVFVLGELFFNLAEVGRISGVEPVDAHCR